MGAWSRESRIRRMHAHGWSQRDIAAEISVSQMTISREMRRLGLRPNGHWSQRARIKRRKTLKSWLWREGMPSLAACQTIAKAQRERI